MQSVRTPLLTTFFIFLFLFLFTKLFGPIPFSINSVQTNKTNLFSVSGVGEATAIPDIAQISIGVTKTATTVSAAQDQVNTTANKLIADLKALGIADKDIKTTNYSVNPNYDYSFGRQNANGYTISQNLDVKVQPIDKANQVIDKATADGANLVGNIQFTLDDDKKKSLQDAARKQAVRNAKDKAQSLADAAGIRLGRILDVQESGDAQPVRFMAESQGLAIPDAKSTTITPGENTINVTITLSYETD